MARPRFTGGNSKRRSENVLDRVRELHKLPENRQCRICESISTYICTNYYVFVCETCAGVMREYSLSLKGVSMTRWSTEDAELIALGGNLNDAVESGISCYQHEVTPQNVRMFIETVWLKKPETPDATITRRDINTSQIKTSKGDSLRMSRPGGIARDQFKMDIETLTDLVPDMSKAQARKLLETHGTTQLALAKYFDSLMDASRQPIYSSKGSEKSSHTVSKDRATPEKLTKIDRKRDTPRPRKTTSDDGLGETQGRLKTSKTKSLKKRSLKKKTASDDFKAEFDDLFDTSFSLAQDPDRSKAFADLTESVPAFLTDLESPVGKNSWQSEEDDRRKQDWMRSQLAETQRSAVVMPQAQEQMSQGNQAWELKQPQMQQPQMQQPQMQQPQMQQPQMQQPQMQQPQMQQPQMQQPQMQQSQMQQPQMQQPQMQQSQMQQSQIQQSQMQQLQRQKSQMLHSLLTQRTHSYPEMAAIPQLPLMQSQMPSTILNSPYQAIEQMKLRRSQMMQHAQSREAMSPYPGSTTDSETASDYDSLTDRESTSLANNPLNPFLTQSTNPLNPFKDQQQNQKQNPFLN